MNKENPYDILESYFHSNYNFQEGKLTKREIREIKDLANEKRLTYNIAPIGSQVFRYISEKENNLFFELEEFESENIDAISYLLKSNNNCLFFIINIKKALINQIFVAGLAYYFYIIKDDFHGKNFKIWSLCNLKNKNEQKALRFASEFLLPENALHKEIDSWLIDVKNQSITNATKKQLAELCYKLTIKYSIPLQALLIRLQEENYLTNAFSYIHDDYFIEIYLQESEYRYSNEFVKLMGKGNDFVDEIIYKNIIDAYKNKKVSSSEAKNDINNLGLNKDLSILKTVFNPDYS